MSTFNAKTDTPIGAAALAADDRFLIGRPSTDGWDTITAGEAILGMARVATGGQPAVTNAVLPTQSSNAGKFLKTDGTNASWASVPNPDLTPYAVKDGGNTFTGTQKVGAVGGTAGRQLWLSHDDSNAYVESRYGDLALRPNALSNALRVHDAGDGYPQLNNTVHGHVDGGFIKFLNYLSLGRITETLYVGYQYAALTGGAYLGFSATDVNGVDTTLNRNTGGGILGTTTVTDADLLTLKAPASHTGDFIDCQSSVGASLVRLGYVSGRSYMTAAGGMWLKNSLWLTNSSSSPPTDNEKVGLTYQGVYIATDAAIYFGSENYATSTPDTGLARSSAGVVKVTDGGSGYGNILSQNVDALGLITTPSNVQAAYLADHTNSVAYIQTNTDSTHAWTLVSRTTTRVPLSIQGAASQSANLQEWQNSDGSKFGLISRYGYPYFGYSTGTSPTYRLATFQGNRNHGAHIALLSIPDDTENPPSIEFVNVTDGADCRIAAFANDGGTGSWLQLNAGGATGVSVWRPDAYGCLLRIGPDGDNVSPSAMIDVQCNSSGKPGIIVKGAASQSANLQEWQDSTGAALVYIGNGGAIRFDNSGTSFGSGSGSGFYGDDTHLYFVCGGIGQLTLTNGTAAEFFGSVGINGSDAAANLHARASSAGAIPLSVRGAASQSANLQEWQDSVGGKLAYIGNDGFQKNPHFEVNDAGVYRDANVLFTLNSGSRDYLFNGYDAGQHRMSLSRSGYFRVGPSILSPEAMGMFQCSGPSDAGVIVQLAADQEEDAFRVSDSVGTVLSGFNNAGQLFLSDSPYIFGNNQLFLSGKSDATGTLYLNYGGGSVVVGSLASPVMAPLAVQVDVSGTGFVVMYSGTEYTRYLSGGLYKGIEGNGSNPFVISNGGDIVLTPNGTVKVTDGVGGYRNVEAQSVLATGQIVTPSNVQAGYLADQTNSVAYVQTSTDSTHAWMLFNRTASKVPFSVQGAASQTANLQEWQDSVGGTLAKIGPDGGTTVPYLAVSTSGGITCSSSVIGVNSISSVYLNGQYAVLSSTVEASWVKVRKNTAPDDSELAAGELAYWFDKSNGAAKVMFKGKTADGTVVTAELAMAP